MCYRGSATAPMMTIKLKAGEREAVEFLVDKAGVFEYYYFVGSHRQMGMKGDLIVE